MIPLPTILPSVPTQYVTPGMSQLCAPLAMQLINMGMITDADLQPTLCQQITTLPHIDEKYLAEQALTRWWNAQIAPLTLFNWSLHVQTFDWSYTWEIAPTPWFCLEQKASIPQITLARGVGALEDEIEGFGQTVMALLQDAFEYLPWSYTPTHIFNMVRSHYWEGHPSSEAWITKQIGPHGEFSTREELQASVELFTEEDFYQHTPRWIAAPVRQKSYLELSKVRSAHGKLTLAACDAIHKFVLNERFALKRHYFFNHHLWMDSVGSCAFLRWSDDDCYLRVIDDALEMTYGCGEYNEFISANPVSKPQQLPLHMKQIEQMCELAVLVERLLLQIGEEA